VLRVLLGRPGGQRSVVVVVVRRGWREDDGGQDQAVLLAPVTAAARGGGGAAVGVRGGRAGGGGRGRARGVVAAAGPAPRGVPVLPLLLLLVALVAVLAAALAVRQVGVAVAKEGGVLVKVEDLEADRVEKERERERERGACERVCGFLGSAFPLSHVNVEWAPGVCVLPAGPTPPPTPTPIPFQAVEARPPVPDIAGLGHSHPGSGRGVCRAVENEKRGWRIDEKKGEKKRKGGRAHRVRATTPRRPCPPLSDTPLPPGKACQPLQAQPWRVEEWAEGTACLGRARLGCALNQRGGAGTVAVMLRPSPDALHNPPRRDLPPRTHPPGHSSGVCKGSGGAGVAAAGASQRRGG
jgi:hypothetical protein